MATLNILKLSITSNSECPWIIFLGSCAGFTTKHHQWILSHGSQETIGETHMIGFESSVYSRQMCSRNLPEPRARVLSLYMLGTFHGNHSEKPEPQQEGIPTHNMFQQQKDCDFVHCLHFSISSTTPLLVTNSSS
jgi:hypothetical protein